MRKFSFKVAMVAVVATVAGMGIYSSQKADAMSDIALANVEALAQSEGSVTCEYDPGDTCRVGSTDVPDYDEVNGWHW